LANDNAECKPSFSEAQHWPKFSHEAKKEI